METEIGKSNIDLQQDNMGTASNFKADTKDKAEPAADGMFAALKLNPLSHDVSPDKVMRNYLVKITPHYLVRKSGVFFLREEFCNHGYGDTGDGEDNIGYNEPPAKIVLPKLTDPRADEPQHAAENGEEESRVECQLKQRHTHFHCSFPFAKGFY